MISITGYFGVVRVVVPDSFKLWYDKTRHQFCINKARATVTKCPSYQIGTWLKRRLTNIFEI